MHSSTLHLVSLLVAEPQRTVDAPLRGVLPRVQGAPDVDDVVGRLAGGQPDLHKARALPPPHKVSDVVSAPEQLYQD